METERIDCKAIVMNRLRRSGLAAEAAPELIRTLASRLFQDPNLSLSDINNELKYTKWRGFELNAATWAALGNCLGYEGMKGLEYRLGFGFLRLAS